MPPRIRAYLDIEVVLQRPDIVLVDLVLCDGPPAGCVVSEVELVMN